MGDYLIVAVQNGDCILKTKPDAKVLYTTEQRIELIKALRVVDEVIVYRDVDVTLPTVDFDIFAKGHDQNHAGFQRAVEWCKAHGKEVVVVPRTENISSTMLREVQKDYK